MIKFQPHLGRSVLNAGALYLRSDYALIVGPERKIPPNSDRLSIDDLTLFFNPSDHQFIGFEAYTNPNYWKYRQLVKPIAEIKAPLLCIETFDVHGIARSDPSSVNYIYSRELFLLKIELALGQIHDQVCCLSCIICTLGNDGELKQIWIEGVSI
jgi:hypothetical protein